MKINFANFTSISALKNSVAVVLLTEEEAKKSSLPIVKLAKEKFDFTGKSGQMHLVQDVVVVGVGEEKKLNETALQKVAAKTVSYLNAYKIKDATLFFGFEINEKGAVKAHKKDAKNQCNLAFGALLQSYRFNKYFEKRERASNLN